GPDGSGPVVARRPAVDGAERRPVVEDQHAREAQQVHEGRDHPSVLETHTARRRPSRRAAHVRRLVLAQEVDERLAHDTAADLAEERAVALDLRLAQDVVPQGGCRLLPSPRRAWRGPPRRPRPPRPAPRAREASARAPPRRPRPWAARARTRAGGCGAPGASGA